MARTLDLKRALEDAEEWRAKVVSRLEDAKTKIEEAISAAEEDELPTGGLEDALSEIRQALTELE